jgi:predicted peptidase
MRNSSLSKILILSFALIALATISPAQQTVHRSEFGLQYLKYLPEDYEANSERLFPLLLFLHGGGEVGDSIELVKKHGPPKLIEQGKEFPFIVVSPQNPANRLWDDAALKQLVDEILATHRVDRRRIYLTGLSRGGFGAWRTGIQYPELFAAVIPICGRGTPNYVHRLKAVPVWVFHGAKDRTVPLSNSVEMVEALQEAGGEVTLTVYPEAGHDSWTVTYENPAVYEWLLSQQKPEE